MPDLPPPDVSNVRLPDGTWRFAVVQVPKPTLPHRPYRRPVRGNSAVLRNLGRPLPSVYYVKSTTQPQMVPRWGV